MRNRLNRSRTSLKFHGGPRNKKTDFWECHVQMHMTCWHARDHVSKQRGGLAVNVLAFRF